MDPESIFMRNAKWRYCCQLMMLGLSFLYFFSGFLNLGTGISTQFQLRQLTPLIEIDMTFTIMLLIVGILLMILSCLGCKGANGDTMDYLIIHSIFTFNGILVSVVMTVLCTVAYNGVMHAPNHFDELITAFQNYENNGTYVNGVQIKYQCCGLNPDGYKYWNGTIPASCYKNPDSVLINIPWTTTTLNEHGVEKVSDVLYTKGCIEEILNAVNVFLLPNLIMNYISVITLILGFICSIVLCILKSEPFASRPSSSPESMPQPYIVPVVPITNSNENMVDRPPTYEEAVSAFQVMEPDVLRISEEIEMNYLPASPPAYDEINFNS